MFKLFLVIVVLLPFCKGECESGCDIPTRHYEELGCEPIYQYSTDCCPKYYNCTEVDERDPSKCYLKGLTFEKYERVDDNLTQTICEASCTCVKEQHQDFDCAEIECPEDFGNEIIHPGCYYTYKSGHCCSIGHVCRHFNTPDKCEYDRKTFQIGQRFYPNTIDCLQCICQPGFEGKLVEPYCTKIDCGTELIGTIKFLKKYAPIYFMNRNCCLITWQKPFTPDLVTNNENSTQEVQEVRCKFGTNEYNIGDKFSVPAVGTSSPNILCKCMIPPLITCIEY